MLAYHKFTQRASSAEKENFGFGVLKKYIIEALKTTMECRRSKCHQRTRKKRFVIDIEEKEYSLLTNEEHRILTLDNIW